MDEKLKIAHLLRRAGFGFSLRKNYEGNVQQVYQELLNQSSKFEKLALHHADVITPLSITGLTPEQRKTLLAELAANVKLLNLEWIKLMGRTEGQLREKLALFWHGHFAVRTRGYEHVTLYINTLRSNALGNFRTLLMEISKEPAMLKFLNNQQNRKSSPNENFARELLELFTLGRGNYSEKDIKEAARSFTGWGFDRQNSFVFRKFQHDFGEKHFLGKTGNFTGEDVINIILEQKQTAHFIAAKMYRFFVNETPNPEVIAHLGNIFYDQNYEIKPLLSAIFESEWFYEEQNRGSLIKSPTELMIGIHRTFGVSYSDPQPLLVIQRLLGQMLFFPPNVSGWAGNRNWIDNSTLPLRMNLASLLAHSGQINVTPKSNDNDEMDYSESSRFLNKNLNCSFNWELFNTRFNMNSPKENWASLCQNLLAIRESETPLQPSNNDLNTMALYLTKLPEYQIN